MRGLLLVLVLALAAPASAALRVVSAEGALTVAGKPVPAGTVIPEGAKLELASGTATLADERGRFLLRGPAVLIPKKHGVSLNLGGLLSVLRKGLKGYAVRTPTALAAVRGTDFYVEARGKDETYVCVCRGRIETMAQGIPAAPLEAERHNAQRFIRKGGKVEKQAAPFEGHSDAELDALRAAL